uniref:Uncharacterized protein n=1 Tax=Oryza meridionalis TaxID=40149 RepID=A0A0E0EGJ2_9ORYZ
MGRIGPEEEPKERRRWTRGRSARISGSARERAAFDFVGSQGRAHQRRSPPPFVPRHRPPQYLVAVAAEGAAHDTRGSPPSLLFFLRLRRRRLLASASASASTPAVPNQPTNRRQNMCRTICLSSSTKPLPPLNPANLFESG